MFNIEFHKLITIGSNQNLIPILTKELNQEN